MKLSKSIDIRAAGSDLPPRGPTPKRYEKSLGNNTANDTAPARQLSTQAAGKDERSRLAPISQIGIESLKGRVKSVKASTGFGYTKA